MKNRISSTLGVGLILLTVILLLSTCVKNPVTGKRDFMLMSKKGEVRMGQQYDPSIVAQYGLYSDDRLQKFINDKGQQMAKISHRPELTYDFKIMDSPVVNAFAVPGGYVYFTRGIMAHFNNEAEFAGVLGHEIGHIAARHSAKQYSKSIAAQVGLIVGVVASKEFRQFANEAQQGLSLLFLKFGRDAESESDALGVEYSTKIGYDAHEMAGFFSTLKRLSAKSGQEIPTFLSTHPDPADRYAKVGQMADEWGQKTSNKNLKINRDQYLQMVDGLVYGEDPRQGYVDGNVFYQPELKFQYPIPRGWQTANSPQQVQHGPSTNDAMLMLALAQGQSLDAAAKAFVEENKINVINSNPTRVNGLSTIVVLGEQVNEQDPNTSLSILSYFIQYNNLIYRMHGMTYKTKYNQYRTTFENTMEGFKKLTDPSKLNVFPEKLKVKSVASTGTLSATLRTLGVPSDRLEEFAILNGMELNKSVKKGTKLKVLEKGNSASRTRSSSDDPAPSSGGSRRVPDQNRNRN